MRRATRWRAVAVLAVAAALALTGCTGGGTTGPTGTETVATEGGPSAVPLDQVPDITSVWWQQAQALPDFDHTAHTTTDPGDIAALRQLLADHGVVDAFRFTHPDCEGGLTTWVRYTTAAGDEVELQTNSCEGADAFERDLNALVSGWREG